MAFLIKQILPNSIKRLPLSSHIGQRCISTASSPLFIQMSQVVHAEPLKKKKKIDPQVLRHREERKKRKIEKSIRKLEKVSSQYKPIDELEVPISLRNEMEIRKRTVSPVSEEEETYRSDLFDKWRVYKSQQRKAEAYMYDNIQTSMNRALEELRNESEDLWLEAIQIDPSLLPFRTKGPVRTPAIENFDAPDGEYFDVTKKWE